MSIARKKACFAQQRIFAAYTGTAPSSVCFFLSSFPTATISRSPVGVVLQAVLIMDIALRYHEDGDENSAVMVSNDVDIAALKKKIDGLDPEFNIRAISADGNVNMVLDMETLRGLLWQGASDSRGTAPKDQGRITNPFKWAPCVKGSKTSERIVSSLGHS